MARWKALKHYFLCYRYGHREDAEAFQVVFSAAGMAIHDGGWTDGQPVTERMKARDIVDR